MGPSTVFFALLILVFIVNVCSTLVLWWHIVDQHELTRCEITKLRRRIFGGEP